MKQISDFPLTVLAVLSAVALLTLAGCQKAEGPAERAGKSLDNAVSQTGQQIQKAGDNIQDAARK